MRLTHVDYVMCDPRTPRIALFEKSYASTNEPMGRVTIGGALVPRSPAILSSSSGAP